MKYLILADSSCDMQTADFESNSVDFKTIPLTLTVGEREFLDDENLDTNEILAEMKTAKVAPKTSCPPPDLFKRAMMSADNVFCVTLSSKLSGTYNSARVAAESLKQDNRTKNIFVIDSEHTSSAMSLIVDKLKELIESGEYGFEQICEEIMVYKKTLHTRFIIQDYSNLIKTGRIGKFAGLIASIFTIKPICGDNGAGEIKMFSKVFGMKKALMSISSLPATKAEQIGNDLPIVISHCNNADDADVLKGLLAKFNFTNIKTHVMRGITTFFGGDKALVLAY